jgi:hypothetical protein
MKKLLLVVAALLVFQSRRADAFCGFYVNGAGGEMFNDATQVVLMRKGTRTVLSMENSYQGPVEDFAMVVPVPVVLHEGDVKTLPKDVFGKIDTMGSPRLVEYWEQDPCYVEPDYKYEKTRSGSARHHGANTGAVDTLDDYQVTIEAQFVVGEYDISILSATDSSGLERWLQDNNYKIPDGAEPLLRPYVEAGSKFFVAKVDPKKVAFDSDGRAQLSPLRFDYDADEFTLPIRLGLAASPGKQDLIVSILSPEGRYKVSNYKNVTIPTNLDVKDSVRDQFGAFYAALFDRTLEKNPGAIVTEYSWAAGTCDPCPGPQLDGNDIATLGGDVLGTDVYATTLTRLHARYGKDQVPDDLVFAKADAIVGGREHVIDPATGKLEEGAVPDSQNNFQARYAIRHEWTGPIACKDPVRHRWGGPPAGESYAGVEPAKDLAHAPRGGVALQQLVRQDVPEIGIKAAGGTSAPKPPQAEAPRGGAEPNGTSAPHHEGCGCSSTAPPDLGLVLLMLWILRRKR